MAQLDAYLKAVLAAGGQELSLASGEPPKLRAGSTLKPIAKFNLTNPQIEVLLKEIISPDLIAKDEARAQYDSPSGTFQVVLRRNNGRIEAKLTHGTAAAETAPKTEDSPPSEEQNQDDEDVLDPHPSIEVHQTQEIDRLFEIMFKKGASDLHLSSAMPPMVRIDGSMVILEDEEKIEAGPMVELIDPIMPERNRKQFEETQDTDFAYHIPEVGRFRCNVFMDRKGPGAVFRIIPTDILTAQQLGLPDSVLRLCKLSKGLVLVTGPTGSGKSTTLAAMIDYINTERHEHIITIEDPIEFVHENRNCLINQREVHVHTHGFKQALRAALREDPDIVLVGEMRDLETIAIAIETAETGHLVFGTLHTTTAPSTVDRIIDQFPEDRQEQIRVMLSESLKGVIAQTLCKKIGGGRVAALEILIVTTATSNLIREGKTFQIPSIMQTSKGEGMCLLNDSLAAHIKKGDVDPKEAYIKAVDKKGFLIAMEQAGLNPKSAIDT